MAKDFISQRKIAKNPKIEEIADNTARAFTSTFFILGIGIHRWFSYVDVSHY